MNPIAIRPTTEINDAAGGGIDEGMCLYSSFDSES